MDGGTLWICGQMLFIHVSVHMSYRRTVHSPGPFATYLFKCTLCPCISISPSQCAQRLTARRMTAKLSDVAAGFQPVQFLMNQNNNTSNWKVFFFLNAAQPSSTWIIELAFTFEGVASARAVTQSIFITLLRFLLFLLFLLFWKEILFWWVFFNKSSTILMT